MPSSSARSVFCGKLWGTHLTQDSCCMQIYGRLVHQATRICQSSNTYTPRYSFEGRTFFALTAAEDCPNEHGRIYIWQNAPFRYWEFFFLDISLTGDEYERMVRKGVGELGLQLAKWMYSAVIMVDWFLDMKPWRTRVFFFFFCRQLSNCAM